MIFKAAKDSAGYQWTCGSSELPKEHIMPASCRKPEGLFGVCLQYLITTENFAYNYGLRCAYLSANKHAQLKKGNAIGKPNTTDISTCSSRMDDTNQIAWKALLVGSCKARSSPRVGTCVKRLPSSDVGWLFAIRYNHQSNVFLFVVPGVAKIYLVGAGWEVEPISADDQQRHAVRTMVHEHLQIPVAIGSWVMTDAISMLKTNCRHTAHDMTLAPSVIPSIRICRHVHVCVLIYMLVLWQYKMCSAVGENLESDLCTAIHMLQRKHHFMN